jgi:hypothetical protein
MPALTLAQQPGIVHGKVGHHFLRAYLSVDFCTWDKPTVNFRTIERGYLLKERTADPGGTVSAAPS